MAGRLFVDGQHVHFAVNKVLGQDADNYTQQPTILVQLATLAMPSLIIHGARDPRPARVAQHLAECIPSAGYVALPNTGHLPWIEDPEMLKGVLRPFLIRL